MNNKLSWWAYLVIAGIAVGALAGIAVAIYCIVRCRAGREEREGREAVMTRTDSCIAKQRATTAPVVQERLLEFRTRSTNSTVGPEDSPSSGSGGRPWKAGGHDDDHDDRGAFENRNDWEGDSTDEEAVVVPMRDARAGTAAPKATARRHFGLHNRVSDNSAFSSAVNEVSDDGLLDSCPPPAFARPGNSEAHRTVYPLLPIRKTSSGFLPSVLAVSRQSSSASLAVNGSVAIARGSVAQPRRTGSNVSQLITTVPSRSGRAKTHGGLSTVQWLRDAFNDGSTANNSSVRSQRGEGTGGAVLPESTNEAAPQQPLPSPPSPPSPPPECGWEDPSPATTEVWEPQLIATAPAPSLPVPSSAVISPEDFDIGKPSPRRHTYDVAQYGMGVELGSSQAQLRKAENPPSEMSPSILVATPSSLTVVPASGGPGPPPRVSSRSGTFAARVLSRQNSAAELLPLSTADLSTTALSGSDQGRFVGLQEALSGSGGNTGEESPVAPVSGSFSDRSSDQHGCRLADTHGGHWHLPGLHADNRPELVHSLSELRRRCQSSRTEAVQSTAEWEAGPDQKGDSSADNVYGFSF